MPNREGNASYSKISSCSLCQHSILRRDFLTTWMMPLLKFPSLTVNRAMKTSHNTGLQPGLLSPSVYLSKWWHIIVTGQNVVWTVYLWSLTLRLLFPTRKNYKGKEKEGLSPIKKNSSSDIKFVCKWRRNLVSCTPWHKQYELFLRNVIIICTPKNDPTKVERK